MQHKFLKISFGTIVLCCFAFCLITINPINAQEQGAQNEGLCSRVGTWHGEADLGFTWMAVKTSGQNAINGQLTLEWINIDPTLFGNFIYATRTTNGVGVWKKVAHHVYQFTWIAYGLDQNGGVLYTMRASGEAESVDCDNADITYVLEVWPADLDISEDPAPVCIPGTATETRMLLVQATCSEL